MPKANRLLVVDDNESICQFIGRVARQLQYQVVSVHSVAEFEAAFHEVQPTLCMLDLQLENSDGVELVTYLAEHRCAVPVALMSGYDGRVLQAVERLGRDRGLNIVDRFEKPIILENLRKLLERQLRSAPTDPVAELRHGIEQGHVIPFYQPKVELATGEVSGVEALARWKHPERGLVSPMEFIPLAEEHGLIGDLTRSVLEASLRDQAAWEAAGLPVSVAVNVSARVITDRGFADQVMGLLRKYSVKPERVILEVTESAAMADASLALEIFSRIRLRGIGLAIDDFGTGYSSLVELQRMPFSEMKVDRQFTSEILNDRDSAVIVKAIIELGHALGLKVVAEGVCSGEIMEKVKIMGADLAQGFHIAKPIPDSEILDWLRHYDP